MKKNPIVFVFLDGFGLASSNPDNPLSYASMPSVRSILDGPIVSENSCTRSSVLLKGVDACLGIDGLPQSATGQTSLLTGVNASKALGYHLPAFPSKFLVDIINQKSLLKLATEANLKATFANAYSSRYFDLVKEGKRVHSVTTHCVLAAGIPFRFTSALREDKAVYWDITNEHLQEPPEFHTGKIPPQQAGRTLSLLANSNDLVLYECFLPDLIGHSAHQENALEFLNTLDGFINGFMENKHENTTLVICSDHGNIEDLSVGTHTRNPVPLIVLGPGAAHFKHASSITDISTLLLEWLC